MLAVLVFKISGLIFTGQSPPTTNTMKVLSLLSLLLLHTVSAQVSDDQRSIKMFTFKYNIINRSMTSMSTTPTLSKVKTDKIIEIRR